MQLNAIDPAGQPSRDPATGSEGAWCEHCGACTDQEEVLGKLICFRCFKTPEEAEAMPSSPQEEAQSREGLGLY